ncbi:MAG: crossover junction endodeoxyribonuclease RuvC [Patescibacteria group bacterium]
MATPLRVLGVDPGFGRTGFGVIEQQGSEVTWLAHGCVETESKMEFEDRLAAIKQKLTQVIQEHRPDCMSLEHLYFQTNVKTAMKVGMARGVIMLIAQENNLPIVELTPNQVKQGITGYGSADKKQVQAMVQRFLHLKDIPQPDDAADALAIAIVGGAVYKQGK